MRDEHSTSGGITLLVLGLFLLPNLVACGREDTGVQGQVTSGDTVLAAILEAEARGQEDSRPTSPRLSAQEQERQPLQISEMGYNLGSSDAPLKVLEISDFGCGYCRRFHEETFPVLRQVYADGGFVEWKYVPFVLGMFPNALEAATAAECAGEQDRFFPMQTRLFSDQGRWRNSDDPYAVISEIAGEEGLDVERLQACIEGGWRDGQVRANVRLGQQLGARGTPYFLIGGRPLAGALPLEDFRSLLDAALRERGITPPAR